MKKLHYWCTWWPWAGQTMAKAPLVSSYNTWYCGSEGHQHWRRRGRTLTNKQTQPNKQNISLNSNCERITEWQVTIRKHLWAQCVVHLCGAPKGGEMPRHGNHINITMETTSILPWKPYKLCYGHWMALLCLYSEVKWSFDRKSRDAHYASHTIPSCGGPE